MMAVCGKSISRARTVDGNINSQWALTMVKRISRWSELSSKSNALRT